MMVTGESLLAGGARAFWIPVGVPPAGTSPGDRSLDPFWRLAEEANVPIMFHIGTEYAFYSPEWYANVPEFEYGMKNSQEFPVEPFRASIINISYETFLGAMILSGVFERFPQLRVGVTECAAHWVGPLAEKLDLWASQFTRLKSTLSMEPSKYLARNIRVAPFPFEPVAYYIERHPDLVDVYAYGSDYPHAEGGKDSIRTYLEALQPLGEEVVNKFFIENGRWILP
jgi:predicted TIM-barrel fold metal-dependent hydrolase